MIDRWAKLRDERTSLEDEQTAASAGAAESTGSVDQSEAADASPRGEADPASSQPAAPSQPATPSQSVASSQLNARGESGEPAESSKPSRAGKRRSSRDRSRDFDDEDLDWDDERLERKRERRRRRRDRRRRASAKTLAVLPSLFTLGNALCGFLAIFMASRPVAVAEQLPFNWTPLTYASIFIFLGMVFDAIDGRIARMTGQTSDLGEQLDSMCDMVTFGVAPAFVAVQLVVGQGMPFISQQIDSYFDRVALMIALIYVACVALRLARFNVEISSPEESDHRSFKGLPSPGAAGTIASLILLHQHLLADHMRSLAPDTSAEQFPWTITAASAGMVVVMLLVSIAMVSRLRYVHVVNQYFRKRAPFETVAVLVSLLLLAAIDLQITLAAGLVIYSLSAPAVWTWRKLMTRSGRKPQPLAAGAAGALPRGDGDGSHQDAAEDENEDAQRHD